ncbi:MAG: PfkB family carbohydrate kinase [Clostridia bacterium]|nr:PfkB family carbohydrate kinase [Clostridia bacterium]
MKKVFVIGGAAVDITGSPSGVCRMRDSNIGKVRLRAGGVGLNIAAKLAEYPVAVGLITALGAGYRSDMIAAECKKHNVSLAHSLVCDAPCATYMCMLDAEGDMLIGISDMKIMNRLSPSWLTPLLDTIDGADMAVLDANLPAESMEFLCDHLHVPIFYDPVSCAKAQRIGDRLGKCYAVKPNRFEAALLSGCSCDTLKGVYRAADWFLNQGVQRVFISLSEEGVYWADAEGCGHIPSEAQNVTDASGAGDAMSAAIIHGCIHGESTEACAQAGNIAGARFCVR